MVGPVRADREGMTHKHDGIMAEHMKMAMEVVEEDEELGNLVIADELDRLMGESLGHWQSDAGPWCVIPHALYKDIALAIRRVRRGRVMGEGE